MSIENTSGLEVLRYAAEEATPGDLRSIYLKTNPPSGSQSNVSDSWKLGNGPVVISVTTTPVLLKVGAVPLAGRKAVVWVTEVAGIKWGFTSSVSTSGADKGFPIFANSLTSFPTSENCAVWLVSDALGGKDIQISEVK